MVRTILVNLRNWGQWMLAAATFVVRKERTVVALTPPPLVVGSRLFLFTAQRVWHRPSRRIVTVSITHAAEYYVFRNIFGNEDYNLARLSRWPDIKAAYDGIVAAGHAPLILDCGANIGLSAVYFALAFPAAHVVAVEPHHDNFRRAVAATTAFPSIEVVEAGVASAPGSARIVDPGMGTDAYRTEPAAGGEVRMLTVPDLVHDAAPAVPFLIKIDIEGFESNLFAANTGWIDDFLVLIIELHDWMLPGQCNSKNFLRAISQYDRDFVHIAENIFSLKTAPAAYPPRSAGIASLADAKRETAPAGKT
jgi:FkbM family methyltransferase